MPGVSYRAYATRVSAVAAALLAATFALTPSNTVAQGATNEIVITVKSVKALDAFDDLSKGDIFARMTIDNDVQVTPVVTIDKKLIKPDWKLTKKVAPGVHKVKFEIIDKDLAVDDPVDVNKVANKRDLDFTVDTKSCKIEGFSSTYKCGGTISRTGAEKKKAEVAFTVSVKK